MADAPERNDFESFKFGGTTPDNVYVKTLGVGGLLGNIKYDYIDPSYPDTVTEIYIFKSGGVSGATAATLTVVYADSSKQELVSVAKT